MKRIFFTLCLLFSFLGLASCSVAKKESDMKCTIMDYEGEKQVSCNPKNVALLYPSYGDIWLASGGTISIGVEDCITRGYASSDITIVGNGTGKDITLENLVAAKPDFTILSHEFPNHDEIAEKLKKYNMAYAIFSFNSYQDYLHILEEFCKINQNNNAYATYGTNQKAKIESIIANAKEMVSKKILLLRSTTTSLKALDNSNFLGAMIDELGSNNIANTNKSLTADLAMEIIIKEDPDIILIVPMGDISIANTRKEEIQKDSKWQTISAVKNNKIYIMEKELFHYKPNIRWGEAYELLFQRIYNEE